MNQKQRKKVVLVAPEMCTCVPLSILHLNNETGDTLREAQVLATEALQSRLCLTLEGLLQAPPLSIVALHIAQLEQMSLNTNSAQLQRRRHHAPAGLLDQVLANVHRVTRDDDLLLLQRESGAVMIFPGVDARGVYSILERVYNSITLLQAETVIPPLALETIFQLGISSYPAPAPSLELLLYQAGQVARQFTLRPAITAQQPAVRLSPRPTNVEPIGGLQAAVPFMELPHILPQHLTQIIPHHMAIRLRCIPVGRHQRYLTVAMSNPQDDMSIHRLQELTGLSIFPVSCNEEELSLLLEQGW